MTGILRYYQPDSFSSLRRRRGSHLPPCDPRLLTSQSRLTCGVRRMLARLRLSFCAASAPIAPIRDWAFFFHNPTERPILHRPTNDCQICEWRMMRRWRIPAPAEVRHVGDNDSGLELCLNGSTQTVTTAPTCGAIRHEQCRSNYLPAAAQQFATFRPVAARLLVQNPLDTGAPFIDELWG
jgi:hypothetical protein